MDYKEVLISLTLDYIIEKCEEGINQVNEMSWSQSQDEINEYVIELMEKMIDKFDKYSLEYAHLPIKNIKTMIKNIIEELEEKDDVAYGEDYKDKYFEGMDIHVYYMSKLRTIKIEAIKINKERK